MLAALLAVLWFTAAPSSQDAPMGTILSSPVIAGRVVYFGSNAGNLYALR